MSCWAVIPLKSPERCKSRLAGAMTAAARRRLARDMFDGVLAAVRSAAVERVLVVTPAPLALPRGVDLVHDAERGLDAALTTARAVARAHGATRLAIVAADLPHVCTADVDALLRAAPGAFALAPDRAGTGTNALCLDAHAEFAFAYGLGSARRHLLRAAQLGLAPALVRRPGLAFDVDTPADHALLRVAPFDGLRAFLRTAGAA